MTPKKYLSITKKIVVLFHVINKINRKGIIFWITLSQIKDKKLILLIIAMSHKWKGAAPNFINMINNIIFWCCSIITEERRKIIDAIDWNKKYFTGCVEGFVKFEIIKSSINLNILTSIHNQIISNDDLIIETNRLTKFIRILKAINKGEMKYRLLGLFSPFSFTN